MFHFPTPSPHSNIVCFSPLSLILPHPTPPLQLLLLFHYYGILVNSYKYMYQHLLVTIDRFYISIYQNKPILLAFISFPCWELLEALHIYLLGIRSLIRISSWCLDIQKVRPRSQQSVRILHVFDFSVLSSAITKCMAKTSGYRWIRSELFVSQGSRSKLSVVSYRPLHPKLSWWICFKFSLNLRSIRNM